MTSNMEIVFELVMQIFNLDDRVIKSKDPGSLKPHVEKTILKTQENIKDTMSKF